VEKKKMEFKKYDIEEPDSFPFSKYERPTLVTNVWDIMRETENAEMPEPIMRESLIESEQRFRAIYNGLPLPTFTWQAEGNDFKLVDWNHAFEEMVPNAVKKYRGILASKYFQNRKDVVVDMRDCLAQKTVIQRELPWNFEEEGEEYYFLVKYTYIHPDQVLIHLEDFTHKQKSRKELKERLKFQELVAGISAAFINLPIEEIDRAIEESLENVNKFFNVEHAQIAEYISSISRWRVNYISMYKGNDIDITKFPTKEELYLDGAVTPYEFPYFTAQMRKGEVGKFNSIDDVPEEMEEIKNVWLNAGIKATLAIPLSVADEFLGAIIIHSYRSEREWSDAEIERLRLVGTIFANTLLRKRAENELDEQVRFERLLSDLSAKFVRLPTDRVEGEIAHSLQLINEFICSEHCTLWKLSESRVKLHATHSFCIQDIRLDPKYLSNVKLPWLVDQLNRRKIVMFSRIDQLPEEASVEKDYFLKTGHKSGLFIPLFDCGSVIGAIAFGTMRWARLWPKRLVKRLQLAGEVFVNAIIRKRAEEMISESHTEINRLKERLEMENIYLREEIEVKNKFENIIGKSRSIKTVLRQVEQVAQTDSTVLLLGETGTGKDLIASAIHNLSLRKKHPMVKVNLAALPPSLMESELFGHEKGAYTGALARQAGRFEVANGSTLFLDEIGELSPEIQVKLLRVLQENQFERLGSSKTINVDVRVIAATNRNLSQDVRDGKFREDLYYRLNVFPMLIPPLRERGEDISLLTQEIVKEFSKTMRKTIKVIPRRAMEMLQRYSWPGNIRQLRNVIEQAMILSHDGVLRVQLPGVFESGVGKDIRLEEVVKQHILDVLGKAGWQIKGPHGAAALLEVKPSTLYSKLSKYGIKRPQ
jgi:formate hydrogenlyase transcriptional activator